MELRIVLGALIALLVISAICGLDIRQSNSGAGSRHRAAESPPVKSRAIHFG